MSGAGRSPVEWAERERRKARKGIRRKVLAWAGRNPAAKRADALMARAQHGAVGEQWTAALLARLPDGWKVFHGRKLPGYDHDFDHILVSPCGTAIVVLDSKRWNASWWTQLVNGRVFCGLEDRHKQIQAVARYASRLEAAVGVSGVRVLPLLVVHGSRVRGGFLTALVGGREVHVLSPPYLVPTLTKAPKVRDPGRAAAVAARVDAALRPYGAGE